MKHQSKSIGYKVKISMKLKWKSIENLVGTPYQFNGILVESIVNPVEISMIYQWIFQWNAYWN